MDLHLYLLHFTPSQCNTWVLYCRFYRLLIFLWLSTLQIPTHCQHVYHSRTRSRRADRRQKSDLCELNHNSASLRVEQFDQEASDAEPAEVTAFASAAAKDPDVAPQSDNNEWSN